MRNFSKILISLLWVCSGLNSCEPNFINNGVSPNLNGAEFLFVVTPDDSVIHVGDTLTIEAILPANFSGNVTLTDGNASLGLDMNYITQVDSFWKYEIVWDNIHIIGIPLQGTFDKNLSHLPLTGILGINTTLTDNSFKFLYQFVVLKPGIFHFRWEPSYLQSTIGKTYTNGIFNVPDHHAQYFPGDTLQVESFIRPREYFVKVE